MSKCSKIREAWANGDRIGALRIAARFFDRSADPDFYRQLRKDPDQITVGALQLLARKFNLAL